MNHDFWLLEEGVYSYAQHKDFVSQKDAPLHISDDVLRYFADTLSWIPTFNPALDGVPSGQGLNWYGPTIINRMGGDLLQRVCTSWSELFASGPERLTLRGFFEWQWPFDEQEHSVREDQLHLLGRYQYLEIDRSWIVQTLTALAYYGKQAATGKFFILHIGI